MNIKNKIFLTLIAIIFAISLFNTNCFAFDYQSNYIDEPIYINDDYITDKYYAIFSLKVPDGKYKDNFYFAFASSSTPFEITYSLENGKHYYMIPNAENLSYFHQGNYYGFPSNLESFSNSINNNIKNVSNSGISGIKYFYTPENDFDSSNSFFNDENIYCNFDLNVTKYSDDSDLFTITSDINNNIPDVERGTEDDNTISGDTTDNTTGGTGSDSENTTDSDDSGGILSSIKEGFTNIGNFFTQIIEKITGFFESIGNWFTELFTKLGDWFSGLAESIGTFFSNLGTDISNKWNEWKEQRRQEKEEEARKEEEEKNKQEQSSQDMSNNLNSATEKFSWYNNVIKNTKDMINVITSTESSATFKVNVNSKYYKGDLAIIDLSWYAPYKEIGDNVICIFCYLSFLWSFFTRLPSILSGSGASNYSIAQIKEDKK